MEVHEGWDYFYVLRGREGGRTYLQINNLPAKKSLGAAPGM